MFDYYFIGPSAGLDPKQKEAEFELQEKADITPMQVSAKKLNSVFDSLQFANLVCRGCRRYGWIYARHVNRTGSAFKPLHVCEQAYIFSNSKKLRLYPLFSNFFN